MKTEKTFIILFIIGLITKLLDIPGHSILIIISSTLISILYFPAAFYFYSDKTLKNQNIVLSIVGGMILAMAPIGCLFKLMYWPGAQVQLIGAIVLSAILLAITFILSKKSKDELNTYYKSYISRIIFWLALSLLLYAIPKNMLINIQHHSDPELARLKIQSFENPDNLEYENALQNHYRQRDSLYMIENP